MFKSKKSLRLTIYLESVWHFRLYRIIGVPQGACIDPFYYKHLCKDLTAILWSSRLFRLRKFLNSLLIWWPFLWSFCTVIGYHKVHALAPYWSHTGWHPRNGPLVWMQCWIFVVKWLNIIKEGDPLYCTSCLTQALNVLFLGYTNVHVLRPVSTWAEICS